jgi:hypothetical protein
MAEAACGGRAYLFDFLRMVRIDAATGEESALVWIDDRGACFFPASDCGGRKRRRDYAPAEDEAESSAVDERSGESRGAEDAAKRDEGERGVGEECGGEAGGERQVLPGRQQAVPQLRNGVPRRGDHGGPQGHARREGQGVPAAGAAAHRRARRHGAAAGTPKFAWYGVSAEDVATVVETWSAVPHVRGVGGRKHGDGLHLSPPQCPYTR